MNKIISSTKFVSEHSTFVKINMNRLKDFSDAFIISKSTSWIGNLAYDLNKLSPTQKINFFFICYSICFSFWGEPEWSIEYQGNTIRGSFGMIVAMGKAMDNGHPILDYGYLAMLSEDDFADIMKGQGTIPLFDERLQILREIGSTMKNTFNGDVMNILSKGLDDVEVLDTIIAHFPSFDDRGVFQGREIYFYKRVQLFISDVFQTIDPAIHKIRSISHITALADYRIPAFLRELGILEYSSDLAHKVDNKIEIDRGSNEEIEIRANTIYAIQLIKELVADRYPNVATPYINDAIWVMGKTNAKHSRPHHLTRTTAY